MAWKLEWHHATGVSFSNGEGLSVEFEDDHTIRVVFVRDGKYINAFRANERAFYTNSVGKETICFPHDTITIKECE